MANLAEQLGQLAGGQSARHRGVDDAAADRGVKSVEIEMHIDAINVRGQAIECLRNRALGVPIAASSRATRSEASSTSPASGGILNVRTATRQPRASNAAVIAAGPSDAG